MQPADQACYGDLLLMADRPKEAEAVFREMRQFASSADEINWSTEGIACSLRAEDGNIARANAWLLSLQTPPAANAPAPSPSAATPLTQPGNP